LYAVLAAAAKCAALIHFRAVCAPVLDQMTMLHSPESFTT